MRFVEKSSSSSYCVMSYRASGGESEKETQLRGMLSAGLITQAEFEQNLATLQR